MSIIASFVIAPPSHALDCASGGPCAIGNIGPGGGIVFLAPTSAGNTTGKFFEAAPNTWNGSAPDAIAQWCQDQNVSIPGLGTAIGTGVTNSATIDTTCTQAGTKNAAEYVRAKSIGGLTDWFLPSEDEMLALYNQRSLLTGVYATDQRDTDVSRYLTSSQSGSTTAIGAYMEGSSFPGSTGIVSKSFHFAVRPMRMFAATEASTDTSPSTESLPIYVLTLGNTPGVSCRSSESASSGSWLVLPSAADCSATAGTPMGQLLGWATTPDFPREIAQRQVSNSWGAYEIFDSNGRISAVFIPAGGATRVTGSGTLYPIWKG